MNAGNHIVEVTHLRTAFGDDCIHEDLDLTIRRGEILALVGSSGSGKSVLMRVISALHTATLGSVRVFGHELVGANEDTLDEVRRRLGVMFQHGALFGNLSVGENVAFALREHTDLSDRRIAELARLKVVLAGLPCSAAGKYPR